MHAGTGWMEEVMTFSWTHNARVRVVSYWLLVACLVLSIYAVSTKDAYGQGVVPPSAGEVYPGLDPRLIGVPITKTDMSAALVAYSEAVEHVRSLETEQATLKANIGVLEPEVLRAQEEATERQTEYTALNDAYQTLILAQYRDTARHESTSTDESRTPEQLRIAFQSVRVSDSLRSSREAAKKRSDETKEYSTQVQEQLTTSQTRVGEIDTELVGARERAQDQKEIVRSGVPIALIDGLEIPVLTMDAYLRAEKTLAQTKPACGITWWSLAGIGRAESNHGRYHGAVLNDAGTVTPAIIGVQLNGNGFAAIKDTDGGLLDGDKEWDRAVGVMQFIPGTWKGYAQDGNGDGFADPQNVYDAALTAGYYLCANARPDMKSPEGRRTAFMRYNASKAYVDFVEAKGKDYELLGVGRFNPAPSGV